METPTYESVLADVKHQLFELTGIEEDKIGENDYLVETLGATSLVALQLYLTCQEHYDIRLTDKFDLIDPITVREVCEKVLTEVEAERAAASADDKTSNAAECPAAASPDGATPAQA